MTRPPRPAFTLLELLLVVALIGVLAALAVPSFQVMYASLRVKAGADTVRAAWADARSHAINEGRPYRFSLVMDHGNYRVAPDSGDYWNGSADLPAPADGSPPPLVIDDALPKGVRFRSPDSLQGGSLPSDDDASLPTGTVDSGSWTGTVTFLPDGSVRAEKESIEIGIQGPNTRPLVIRLRTLTGVVTVRPFQAEGTRP